VSFTDAEYPADPYPGARPGQSFVHLDGTGWTLLPDPATPSCWRADGRDLDEWLAEQAAVPLADRVPVLAYGSNACPSKVTWLREELGLSGPAVVFAADCTGLSSVWAAGTRSWDGQRVATVMAAPGVRERHAVWFADPEQLKVLDACEWRGDRYRLARLDTGEVRLADGSVLDRPFCYTGLSELRMPLLVDSSPVRLADVGQDTAITMTGEIGTDGLAASTVEGQPDPLEWPDRLFVYGTLRPGMRAWQTAEPLLAGPPRQASARGTLYDTGHGFPAMLPGDRFAVPGHLLPLRSPATALPMLDDYEGDWFTRVRAVLGDGETCWVYLWNQPVAGLPEIAEWA
jgi:gamma-glutamylcyclotransferase (GGCT)/AIG2-like uncharacterized protein YtfP